MVDIVKIARIQITKERATLMRRDFHDILAISRVAR